MSNSMLCAVTVSVVAAGALATAARGQLLVNGGFESQPNFGLGVAGDPGFSALTGSQIPGWTIEPGHAATVHNTVLYPTISGNYSVNTDGEGFNGNNINMYQDFASGLSAQYTLSFDWANWFQNSQPRLDVSVVDTVTAAVLAQGSYGLSAGVHTEVFNFVGTGNALRLRIQELPQSGFNDNTFIVDNFNVTQVPAPAGAVALGLVGLGLGRRRR